MRRERSSADMGAMPFEETWPIAVVAAPNLSGTGWVYALTPSGGWASASEGAQPITMNQSVGARLIGTNTSGVGCSSNVTIEIIKPDGSIVRKNNPKVLAAGEKNEVSLIITGDQNGTYLAHCYFELWV